jgi:hypothetical protein
MRGCRTSMGHRHGRHFVNRQLPSWVINGWHKIKGKRKKSLKLVQVNK